LARFDFCSGSYTVQAVNADNQICRNLYPEVNESGSGRSKMVLNPTPGLAKIASFGGAPRGQLEYNGREFIVADTQLYEITQTSGGTGVPITVSVTVRGTGLANDGLPASMVCSQTQLLVASGGSVYLLVLATNAFSQIAASNFTLSTGPAPVRQVEFCDSFFLALIANSGTVCISNVFDASSWNLNGQIVVSVFPENVVGMKTDHRQVWLRGNKKTVVYYASGSLNVFDVVPGGFIEQGGASPFSCDKVDNSLLWIGQDDKGDRVAWRAVGYNASRISTHATELAWQKYPKASDAVSYAYQKFGHSFWQVLFPSANNGNGATWVYDVATGLWHERDLLNVTSGASMGHPSWNHSFWNGTHIVGDWRSSNLYQMDEAFLDNAGVPIVRVRRAPHISTELEVVKHTRFELDMETGLGPEPPLQTGGGAPTVLTLKDANGILWGVTVKDSGLLQTTSGSLGAAQLVYLNVGAATWQLGVTIAGLLTTTSVAFAANPTIITMVAPSSAWDLSVTSIGLLQTSKNNQLFARGPLVWLRFSDDGGHTWSNAQPRDAGQAGTYKTRLRWARLGRARIRTYEISCSDPVPFRIVDAYVNGQPGYQPSKRLTKQYAEVS
jgi:hypothetical protein